MSKALVRIQAKYRPISGEVIGFRLQAAIPNTAGRRMVQTSNGPRATSEEVPAFRKPYLIDESMDYASIDSVSEADVERFAKKLHWAGYDQFEPVRGEAADPSRDRVYQDFEILSK
jgi:hypothetical protein